MNKILFIFEGEKAEAKCLKLLENYFTQKSRKEIECFFYKTNIYVLYDEVSNDYGLDIVEILKNRALKNNDWYNYTNLKNNKFPEIFLFFDFDPQDQRYNIKKVEKMIEYFNNETESGKLYVNYPMIESIKHFKEIPDNQYINYSYKIECCKSYKKFVSTITCMPSIDTINNKMFNDIIKQNIEKIFFLNSEKYETNLEKYRLTCTQKKILDIQKKLFLPKNEVSIINTLVLWPIDYFGDSIYKEIIG